MNVLMFKFILVYRSMAEKRDAYHLKYEQQFSIYEGMYVCMIN